jgi:hypothetical protein
MKTPLHFARSGRVALTSICSCGALALTACQDLPQEPESQLGQPQFLLAAPQPIPHTVTIAHASTGCDTDPCSIDYRFAGSLNWTKGPYYGSRGTFFADVNGDRRADAIVVNDWGVSVRRAPTYDTTSTDFSGIWVGRAYYGSRGTYFADVTGDGRADAIVVNDWGVVVRRSTGTSFGPTDETWISGGYYGTRGTFFADVTGPDADGNHRADAVVVNDWGITVRRSTGSGFAAPQTWLGAAYYGKRGTFFADVTCDGRADAIAVNDNGIFVRPATASTFQGPAVNWTNGSWGSVADSTLFADADGNGCDDAIIANTAGIWVRRSVGLRFIDAKNWTSGRPFVGDVGTFFADVNADNKADAIAVNR